MDRLVTRSEKAIRKEVCWSVSNITAGNSHQIQLALDIGLVDKLIQILIHDDNDVRKEAIWALSNCTQHSEPHQMKSMVQKDALKALAATLTLTDSKSLVVAMEGIENLLKAGQDHFMNGQGLNEFALVFETVGGLDKLEALQLHKNHSIYERAMTILEQFYNEEN